MTSRWTTRSVYRSVWPLLASAACLLTFWYVGRTFCDGYVLDLGSMTAPAPKHVAFLFYWTLFGSAASGFLFLGLTRAVPGRPVSNPGPAGRAAGDRWWLAAGIAGGLPDPGRHPPVPPPRRVADRRRERLPVHGARCSPRAGCGPTRTR